MRSIISKEGAEHKALRQIVQKALAEDHILALHPKFVSIAEDLVFGLRAQTSFDFVHAFSEPFAGQAIALLFARPMEEATAIAQDASSLGLAMGPDAPKHESQVNAACDRLLGMAEALLEGTPTEGFVARLIAAANEIGTGDRQALIDLVVISIFGGVDTTRAQLAFAAYLFAHHPEQWRWLRENSQSIPDAINEVIRTRPTTTWATREATEDFEFDGVTITEGQTLHILVHATGTDPALGSFEGFDIRAERKMHFGFGGGAHHCLGHFVARTDMSAALSVLLHHWKALGIIGAPTFLPDSGNTSPSSLVISPVWD